MSNVTFRQMSNLLGHKTEEVFKLHKMMIEALEKSIVLDARLSLDEMEYIIIQETINRCGGCKVKAAKALKMSRKTMYRRLTKWGALTPKGNKK